MLRPERRRIAIAVVALGALTLLAGAVALRAPLAAAWWRFRLRHGEPAVAAAAAARLGAARDAAAAGPLLDRAAEALAAGRSVHEEPVEACLGAFARLGGEAVRPALRAALDDPDEVLRRTAAEAAARCGEEAGPLVPELLRAAGEDPSWRVRLGALRALGAAGPAAEPAAAALETWRADPGTWIPSGPSSPPPAAAREVLGRTLQRIRADYD